MPGVWDPTCRLYVNGVERTSSTIASVSITYGKQDFTDAFRVGYASVELVNANNASFIRVGDDVVVTMRNSSNVDVTIFTGVVTDFEIGIESNTWLRTKINLMSPLAHLGRKLVGFSNYPSQLSGARVSAILQDAGEITWAQATGKWNDQVGTWAQYENLSGTIASGGRTMGSYTGTAEGANALELLKIAESSEDGWLFETADGKINFDAYNDRYNYLLANGPKVISSNKVLLDSTSMSFSTGFQSSSVQSFDNNGTGKLGTAIGSTDILYSTVKNWMTSAGIDDWIRLYLTRRSSNVPLLSAITVPLSALSTADRDWMISIRNGRPVQITNLPAGFIVIGGTSYNGYIEGWTWSIQQGQAFISLNISHAQFSYGGSVNPASFSITNL